MPIQALLWLEWDGYRCPRNSYFALAVTDAIKSCQAPLTAKFRPNPLIQNAIINLKSWRSEWGQIDKLEIEANIQVTCNQHRMATPSRTDFSSSLSHCKAGFYG